jgi:alginate O-acetyltransferase complex protein AlgI
VTWLVFYVVGRLLEERALDVRRYALAALSSLLLFLALGPATFAFYAALALGVLLVAHLLQRVPDERRRRLLFAAAAAAVVVVIVVFLARRTYIQKYFLYLPSLSYLGFRAIAHLTSAYRRRDVAFSAGLMQMLFFPMLFMGPISRTEHFEREHWDYHDALRRLALGLALLIAGYLAGGLVVDRLRPWDASATRLLTSAVASSFELYWVFSGYTHLIVGLGLLVGFRLPDNFNNPYLATSITDFWRRWHMSLSYFIRDYVYIPLGGNRGGLARKCLNMLVAMTLCGLWHGLTLNYLAWGLYHGILLSIESVAAHHGLAPLDRLPSRLAHATRVALTFTLVTIGWLLFKYPVGDLVVLFRRAVGA